MNTDKLIKIIFYFFITLIFVFGLTFFRTVFSYLLISLIFVFLVNPLVTSIENLGVQRTHAVLIFFTLFFLNLFLAGTILLPMVLRQLESFALTYSNFINQKNLDFNQLPYVANIQTLFDNVKNLFPFIDFDSIREILVEKSNNLIGKIPNLIITYSTNIVRIFSYMVSVPIISFFILKDQSLIRQKFFSIIPNRYFELSIVIIHKVNKSIGFYFRAIFVQMFIIATLSSVILSILGIKFGILIGVLAGVINVIPYLGPLVGIVLAGTTVILTGGPMSLVIWTVLGMWGVQLIDNAIVYPLVMGKNTNLHPVIIILTVIAGGLTFGLLGMLVSVPVVFLTTGLVKELFKNLKEFEII